MYGHLTPSNSMHSIPPPIHLPSNAPSAAAAAVKIASRRGFSLPEPIKSLPSQRDRGRDAGMKNLGNSCYLSAVLQALLGQRCFVSDLLSTARLMGTDTDAIERKIKESAEKEAAIANGLEEDDRMIDDDTIAESDDSERKSAASSSSELIQSTTNLSHTFYHTLVSLVLQMRESSHGILDTTHLKEMIGTRYKKFAGTQQQDAHEFLSECLSHLDDDIVQVLRPHRNVNERDDDSGNDANEMDTSESNASHLLSAFSASPSTLQLQVDTISPIYKNLHCEIEQTLQCVKCAYTRTKSEHFNDISLDLPDAVKTSARSSSPAANHNNSPAPLSPNSTDSLTSMQDLLPSLDTPDASASPSLSTANGATAASQATSASSSYDERPITRHRKSTGDILLPAVSIGVPCNNAPPPPIAPVKRRKKRGGHRVRQTGTAASAPPIPTPDCPKHGHTMVPALVQGISTSHFRCTVPRCAHEKVISHAIITPADTVALSTLTPAAANKPTATANNNLNPARKMGSYLASLSHLLSTFFQPHIINYRCDRCDSGHLRKSYSFKQLPRILILHVKRFQPNLLRGTYEKRTDRIRIDENIDLSFACTRTTRKPMPVEHELIQTKVEPQQQQEESKSNLQSSVASSPTATSVTSLSASAADHATFATLFASTATAACKCGASGSCAHSQGILTEADDIAAFIAGQQKRMTSKQQPAILTSPTRKNKRKSSDLNGVTSTAAETAEPNSSRKKKSKNGLHTAPMVSTDSASYFDSDSLTTDPTTAAANISRMQSELRLLQQQMTELSNTPLISATSASSVGPKALPGRQGKRESALNTMVLKASEMEAQIKDFKEKLAQHARIKQNGTTSSTSSSSPTTNSIPSSPTVPDVLPSTSSALSPGVVPAYELAAIIHHKGPIATSGHYITDLKSSGSTGVDGSNHTGHLAQWKRYDDAYVRTLDTNQAVQYGEREGYLFFYQYQPVINLLHMQQERLNQEAAAKYAAEHSQPIPVEPTPIVTATVPPAPVMAYHTNHPHSHVTPALATIVRPTAPSSTPTVTQLTSLCPFGPNAGRFKRWKMVRGERIIWWVDKQNNVVSGQPPNEDEVDKKV